MKEMYFTIAGCNHYYGSDFMEKGMKVKLVKEPDNEYDSEAIQVKIKGSFLNLHKKRTGKRKDCVCDGRWSDLQSNQ